MMPLKLAYEQLSLGKKALIRAWYHDMPAADEPPIQRAGPYSVMDAVRNG